RLHRTRRQLRQILNNELRADAAEFGLLLNEDEAMGWQETRQWCWICGKQRLRGIFERQPSGVTALRLRCPNCSRHSEYDITHTGNWSCLGNIRSFRPAIKRMLQAGPDFYRTVLRQRCCNICHSIVQFQIIDRSTLDTVDSVYAPLLPGMYIQVVCPLCGDSLSLLLSTLLVHPAIRDFLIDRTRLLYEPDSFATF